MNGSNEGPPHPLLVDPDFWRREMGAMARVPERLLIFPRPDLSEPGVEVVEFSLRAHDGARLRGLYARSAFRCPEEPVPLRLTPLTDGELDPATLAWEALRDGEADLVLALPADRRLRDRVLDILRMMHAAEDLKGLGAETVELDLPGEGPIPDELLIARHLICEQSA